jgi:hypothetical protein
MRRVDPFGDAMTPAELAAALAAIDAAQRSQAAPELHPPGVPRVSTLTMRLHQLAGMAPDALVAMLARVAEGVPDAERAEQYRRGLELAYIVGRLAVARQVFERAVVDEFVKVSGGTKQ